MDCSDDGRLTDREISILRAAFDAAIKSQQDSIQAASVLLPLFEKIVRKYA